MEGKIFCTYHVRWAVRCCTSTLWWRRELTHCELTLWYIGRTTLRADTVITLGTVNRTSSRNDECLIGGKEQRCGGGTPGQHGTTGVPLHIATVKKCVYSHRSRHLGMPFVFFSKILVKLGYFRFNLPHFSYISEKLDNGYFITVFSVWSTLGNLPHMPCF